MLEERFQSKEMDKELRIMEWNANGLLQHQQELQVVLDIEKIDICLIAETHFTTQSYTKFRGYKTYHTIHPENAAKGGSAIIIKESIMHHVELEYKTEAIQATAVTVKTKRQEVTVVALYSPPKHALKRDHYLEFFRSQGNRFIIGGDFNAKNTYWGSRLTTTKGKELLEAINEYKCESLSTGKPTYWPTDPQKIPDLIDFFIIKNVSVNYMQIEEGWDMNSDHSPIVLTISEHIIKKENNPTLINNLTDWQSFKTDLEEKINLAVPLQNIQQLDEEVQLYVKHIQEAAWDNTPIIKRKTEGNNYPREIRDLISEKRKLRRKWHQSRAPVDKTNLNNATQRLKREIQNVKNETINTYLSQLTNDAGTEYSLWKATKGIKRPIIQIPPIRMANGTWAKNSQQKADIFAKHLYETFQPNDGDDNLNQEIAQQDAEISFTSPKEIMQEIANNIDPKKAPGYDLITGEILKQLPRKAIVKLTHLINASYRLKYVPQIWKIAEVIMIHKTGKPPHEVSSYRPISLLPVLSKLFEKLLLKRLKPIIEQRNLIPTHQFGFRECHSTLDQVHRITNVIEKALEEKKVCSTVFLDVTQAFDKVWHKGLKYKMKKNLPRQLSDILESYISDRYFRIKYEQAYSVLQKINAGVPQGSVLGPLLYLLYTSDIPEPENNTLATYADDTAILAVGNSHEEAAEKLQNTVNKINTWTKNWRIQLNETKSIHINFTNKTNQHIPININGNPIPYSNTAKYLGITLDAKLRWKAHIKKKREELGIKYRKMYWLIGRNSKMSLNNKLMLYKQILKPTWSYGIQLWGCAKKSHIQVIQRFQNKVLRNIVDAPWYIRNSNLHRDLEMDTVEQVRAKIAAGHELRLHHHVNVEAIQLLDNTGLVRRLKRIKPFELVQ